MSGFLHRKCNELHGKKLEEIFLDHRPDVILGTHFFPMEVAAFLKRGGQLKSRLITVLTDFLPHTVWIAPAIDGYVIGSEKGEEELVRRGVQPEKIRCLGIPTHPKFSKPQERPLLERKLGLEKDRFTLLIGSGGTGTGPVPSLVRTLEKVQGPLQILVAAGTNEGLVNALEGLKRKLIHPMKVFGFIDNMEELMSASDLLITKPGGLTCAEAMVQGLPMLLIPAIPGQEGRNGLMAEELGAGIRIHRLGELPGLVEALRADPRRLAGIGSRAREASFPDAAKQIAQWVRDESSAAG
ncbi:MAG: hypothetical protein HYZ90_03280 [Candidatus Omnitrophica bacterium]|nr:hypothetical protein [Candidatus Omnitrophota bacterium]